MSADAAAVRSDALHSRVLHFALRGAGTFESVALDIARFQVEEFSGHARLLALGGGRLDSLHDVPAVPVEAFRLGRVAVHAEADDVARFETSGTTGHETGAHHFRTLTTCRTLAVELGRRHLLSPDVREATIVALAPAPRIPQRSSLGFMMSVLMEALDGRGLGEPTFDVTSDARWLHGATLSSGVARAADVARARHEPLVVLGAAFAHAALLDALGGSRIALPEGSVAMVTGGFKGRAREVPEAALRESLATSLGLEPANIVGEYGMTELSSQLWEPRSLRTGARPLYRPPPWLRVVALDAVTLEPVQTGRAGLACFVDLGNVDSALRVLTQDEVVVHDDGVELLGRARGAPPRGCSLALEAWLPR